MRLLRVIALTLVAGCGQSYAASDTPATSDGGSPDATTTTTTCLDRPFTDLTFYPSPINDATPYAGWLAPDGGTLFFSAMRTGDSTPRLYTSTRSGSTWGAPAALGISSGTTSDREPSLTSDGLTLYFSSLRPGGRAGTDLWTAHRSGAGAAFDPPTLLGDLSSDKEDREPWPTASGGIYWASSRETGAFRIWSARTSGATGGFTTPTPLAELSTVGESSGPVLTADEKTIFFASNRGNGKDDDVYVARRANVTDPFGDPVRVAELSTSALDRPTWISADGCKIIVATDGRPGSSLTQLLYAERR